MTTVIRAVIQDEHHAKIKTKFAITLKFISCEVYSRFKKSNDLTFIEQMISNGKRKQMCNAIFQYGSKNCLTENKKMNKIKERLI